MRTLCRLSGLALLIFAGCDGNDGAPPSNINPYAANPAPQNGGRIPAGTAGQATTPHGGVRPEGHLQNAPAMEVPRAGYSAELGVPLSFLEYVTFARKSAEMLGEMTKIHAAVSESGNADQYQQRWGELTAGHTALAREVVDSAYPPVDLANELARNVLPRLHAELQQAKAVMEEFDDVEGGLAQPYAQAQQIFSHLSRNLSSAEMASLTQGTARSQTSPPDTAGDIPNPAAVTQDATTSPNRPSLDEPGRMLDTGVPPDSEDALVDRSSSGAWRVTVDPAETTLSLTNDARLGIDVPGPRTANDAGVLYPRTPSPYVLLGTNAAANQKSEVWNLQTRRKEGTIKGLSLGSSHRMALRADGRYLAAQPMHEALVGVWDVDAEKPLGRLPIKEWAGVEFVGFGTGDRLIVVDGEDLLIAVLPDFREERRVTLPAWRSEASYAVSPGQRYLAFHAGDAVRLYDLTICQEVGNLPMEKRVRGMAFRDDGAELAALYDDPFDEAGIVVWDVSTGRQKSQIPFEQGIDDLLEPNSSYRGPQLEWFPDGQHLLVAGCGVVDRPAGELVLVLPAKVSFPVSPIGSRLLGVVKEGEFESYAITEEQMEKARSVAAAGGKAMDSYLPPLTASDRSDVQSLNVQRAQAVRWGVSPERLGGGSVETKPQSSISIPSGQIYRGSLSSPAAGRIALMYSGVPIRTRTSSGWGLAPTRTPVRIDLYDTRRSRKLSSYELPFTTTLESLSPDGTLAVTRIADGMDRLDVWNLDDKSHVCGLRPYSHLGEDSRNRDVLAVTFVDRDHLLTMNNQSITLHEISTGRVIYEIGLEGVGRPVVSPSRSFFALLDTVNPACHIFDALSGQQVGSVTCRREPSSCGFHPNGQSLAIMIGNQTGGEVQIVDMANGQVTDQFPVPRSGSVVHWMGDTHLLVGGEQRLRRDVYLIDVPRKMVVWNYGLAFGMHIWDSSDGRHWYLSASDRNARSFAVNALSLPEPEVASFLEEHAETPQLVLQPGEGIDVLVNVQDPPGESDFADRVRRNIISRYREAGVNVVAGHPLVLSITGSRGSTGRSLKFGSFLGRGSDAVDVAEQEVRWDVTVVQNGETIWENHLRYTNGGVVWMKDGDDVTSKAGEQMWQTAIAGLLQYQPPVYVFPEDARDGLGASQLTPRGSVTQFRSPDP